MSNEVKILVATPDGKAVDMMHYANEYRESEHYDIGYHADIFAVPMSDDPDVIQRNVHQLHMQTWREIANIKGLCFEEDVEFYNELDKELIMFDIGKHGDEVYTISIMKYKLD
ncbi:hypothetical protein VPHD479_0218 [Vibrio phage D479]